MSIAEGFFVDWDGNARSTLDPGGGYSCETDRLPLCCDLHEKRRLGA